MNDEVEQWAEESGLERDGSAYRNQRGDVVLETARNGHLIVNCDGDMAVQGRFSHRDGEWLYIEGERYAWDQGRVQYDGTFAVMMYMGRAEIDGPQ